MRAHAAYGYMDIYRSSGGRENLALDFVEKFLVVPFARLVHHYYTAEVYASIYIALLELICQQVLHMLEICSICDMQNMPNKKYIFKTIERRNSQSSIKIPLV